MSSLQQAQNIPYFSKKQGEILAFEVEFCFQATKGHHK